MSQSESQVAWMSTPPESQPRLQSESHPQSQLSSHPQLQLESQPWLQLESQDQSHEVSGVFALRARRQRHG